VVNRVRVNVPATSANLGPGFDAIGIALELRGEVDVSISQRSDRQQPSSADQGMAMAREAIERVFQRTGRDMPSIEIALHGQVPVARGLGSSAIVRTGAALAAFALAGETADEEWVLNLVTELEGHADNATPALFGGLQVVSIDEGRVTHVRVPIPNRLHAVLFVPEFEMSTDEGRNLLPSWWKGLSSETSRSIAIRNGGRASLLVAALATGRLDVLRTATQDQMHQPARSALFPAMYEIIDAANDAGAVCAYLSGGGSTILAMAETGETQIGEAMVRAAAAAGVRGSPRITEFSERGAEIMPGEQGD
jgi:homoserine kinase